MTRTFSFLFLFLFLASCGKGGGGGSSSSSGSSTGSAEITQAELTSDAAPVQAQTFEINAKLSGFSRDQEDKIYEAFELIKKVVASDQFKRQILNKKFKGKRKFFDNNGMSNALVYKKILEGSEMLSPGKNNTMDLHLKSYYTKANVIGYTMPSIKTIYLNTRYLDMNSFKANQVAMNVTHEWLHKLGFKHSSDRTPERPHSVPYAVGYIMKSLASRNL
jgi:hypothetical protein